MALDGYLAAVSSAFDSATYGLIRAIEDARHIPEAGRTPDRQITWTTATTIAASPPAVVLQSSAAVGAALAGWNAQQPVGWLAQARRLRNRSTHMDTIARLHFVPHQPAQLKVPGLGNVLPIPYLTGLLPQIRTLTSSILIDADTINPFICGPACTDEICARIPGARKVIVGDSGHMIFVEQAQAFHDEVAGFLTPA
jgi:pimeloyl-ACP methyl ester carboxylesterase